MLEIPKSDDGPDNDVIAFFLGGATGFVIVFIVLSCACWLRKSSSSANDANDGYQDIRETNHRSPLGRPFKKAKKTVSNGTVTSPPNALTVASDSSGHPSRFYQFPAAPLPVLPTSSTPSASIIGAGRGTLTRESSTSELYASVDRNPGTNDSERRRRRRSFGSRDDGGNENGEEHTYSKIRPPPGTYDEIDEIAVPSTSRTGRPPPMKIGNVDPFYSRLSDLQTGKGMATVPPPVPRLPLKRASHPYDYPKFLSQNGRDRWQGMEFADSRIPKAVGGDTTPITSGDAVYSKIESQYGGSEDPYSSIKSEEHYSSVLPNRASNGSSSDENANVEGPGDLPPSLHGRTGTVPAYGSIRPRAVRNGRPRRSRSDGEEYSVIRKPVNRNNESGQDAVAYEPRAPPVPEKRYFGPPFSGDWRQTPTAFDPTMPSTSADYGRSPSTGAAEPSFASASASADSAGKREPSYRFITVRESLDALRARMEAAASANASAASVVSPTAVGSAHSDSSLHYYATISEHSYEVVPSRRGSERHAQREQPNIAGRPVSYIDDDEYELGEDGAAPLLHPSDLSPTSTALDSNTSSNTLMNVSIHSQTDSHTTSTGSHVTLVHVGGAQASAGTSTSPPDQSNTAKVHLRRSPHYGHHQAMDIERRKARVCRMASSDDSSSSTGAALSIDIESSFGIDENLSMVDQRDFNPSTAGDMDARSGYNLDVVDGGHREPARPGSKQSPSAKSPEIVDLETLENFNVSSSNSLNEEDLQAKLKQSGGVSYQL